MSKKIKPVALETLEKIDEKIVKDLKKIKLALPTSESLKQFNFILKSFENLHKDYHDFQWAIKTDIDTGKTQAKEYCKSMEISKKLLQKVNTKRKRIRSQEVDLNKREFCWKRSLKKIKGLWQGNIVDMESSLKTQKHTLNRIRDDYFTAMKRIELEINEVLAGKIAEERKIEEKSEETEKKQGSRMFITEDIANFRSYSAKSKEKVLEKDENSCEPLKNPLETNKVGLEEVANALKVLKRANLINTNGNHELFKIAELIKDPENSLSIELMIQLLEIDSQKRQKPTNSKRKSLKPQIFPDNEGTSREKYIFSAEKSFNRTILSNEFLLSPQNADFSESYFQFPGKKEVLTDVKLEDLMNVPCIYDDFDMLSADTSVIQDLPGVNVFENSSEVEII